MLTTVGENITIKIEDFVNKRERQDKAMAAGLPYSRELYIDVVTEESRVKEIFLYQVDFSRIRASVPKNIYIKTKNRKHQGR